MFEFLYLMSILVSVLENLIFLRTQNIPSVETRNVFCSNHLVDIGERKNILSPISQALCFVSLYILNLWLTECILHI